MDIVVLLCFLAMSIIQFFLGMKWQEETTKDNMENTIHEYANVKKISLIIDQ